VGAEISGGNFWMGFATGGIVAAANHLMHTDPPDETPLQRRLRELGWKEGDPYPASLHGITPDYTLESFAMPIGKLGSMSKHLFTNAFGKAGYVSKGFNFRRIDGGFLFGKTRIQWHKHAISPIKGRGGSGAIHATHININKLHIILNPSKWRYLSNISWLPFRW
jgi:hypothetical protein